MYVSEHACSIVSYLLAPAEFPCTIFLPKERVRPVCLSEALVHVSNWSLGEDTPTKRQK